MSTEVQAMEADEIILRNDAATVAAVESEAMESFDPKLRDWYLAHLKRQRVYAGISFECAAAADRIGHG